jgi:hypothetical protein
MDFFPKSLFPYLRLKSKLKFMRVNCGGEKTETRLNPAAWHIPTMFS